MAGQIESGMLIIEQASPHGGICRRIDLLGAGLSPGAIDRRVKAGMLRSIGRGIYQVNGMIDHSTPLHRAVALVPGAIVSHLSAARLHRFPVAPEVDGEPVHITVSHGVSRTLDGIVFHRRRRLPQTDDVINIAGIAATSAARTIVDLAEVLGPARLGHVVQTQVAEDAPSVADLVACFDATARRGVKGSAQLRHLLSMLFGDNLIHQSELERALGTLLTTFGISGFKPQVRPPWYDGRRGTVDFANDQLRTIIEADGRRWHRRDQEMAEDRRRDRLAAKHGWLCIRVTWAEIHQRPAATAADINQIIIARKTSDAA